MKAAIVLRQARRRAGLTQRELSRRAGVPQSTVARIESGGIDPRVGTLDRLLRLCGDSLEAAPIAGTGVDRTLIHAQLRESPAERVAGVAEAWKAMGPIRGAARRAAQPLPVQTASEARKRTCGR